MRRRIALGFLLSLLVASIAHAQGVLVNVNSSQHVHLPRPIVPGGTITIIAPSPIPQPQSTYKIKELAVQVRLVDQVAKTQVSQSFVNTGSRQLEVCFVFPLPYDGAIDQLTLLVDGKEFPARLLPAEEARKTYEDIVRKNRDPALLEWMGSGMFKTSVFPVPPGAERKVTLRYSQLCRKDQGVTDFLFPLSTAKYTSHPVEKLEIKLAIESSSNIKNVYSPSHSVEIKRPDDKHVEVSLTAKNEIPTADFRLLYDVGPGEVGASVLSYRPNSGDDGYFLLLASPQIKTDDETRPSKTVVFVLDRSGSMSGEKIEQAKGALKFVLNNLREGDLFNIVAYDSAVESFRPELQKFNDENRKAATGFIAGLYAGGSTNIDGALRTALGQLQDSSRPTYVIFLTDGLPTEGETNEGKIAASAAAANKVHARIFAFGVGYDVNSRLLDKLARANFGQSEYVRPNENLETRVSAFYARVASPVMSGVTIKFEMDSLSAEQGELVNRRYPAEVHDLFAGQQLAIVGRYKKAGAAKVTVTGKVGSRNQKLDFPATLLEKSNDDSHAYIEKLWATRRIGEIIDQIDLKGRNEELVKELVQLSTKHGILTPYTSFIADETSSRSNLAGDIRRTSRGLESLSIVEGKAGFAQRSAKGRLQQAEAAGPRSGFKSGGFGGGGYESADFSGAPSGLPLSSLPSISAGARAPSAPAEVEESRAARVQTIGRKTFYRRGDRWIDADVAADKEKKAVQIKRFSDQYFELIRKHGQQVAKYLAVDEPVVLELEGQVYEFSGS